VAGLLTPAQREKYYKKFYNPLGSRYLVCVGEPKEYLERDILTALNAVKRELYYCQFCIVYGDDDAYFKSDRDGLYMNPKLLVSRAKHKLFVKVDTRATTIEQVKLFSPEDYWSPHFTDEQADLFMDALAVAAAARQGDLLRDRNELLGEQKKTEVKLDYFKDTVKLFEKLLDDSNKEIAEIDRLLTIFGQTADDN